MSGFTIDITGDFKGKLNNLEEKVKKIVDDELNAFGINTVKDAKTNIQNNHTIDEGFLWNHIYFDKKHLSVEIVVAANYGAYIEFGTRGFAAAYVSSLPADWQAFAAQFKGGGGGSFAEFVMRLTEWVHRKQITGTYSIKTRKRTGNKVTQANEDKSAAYRIALSILRKGIKARPFLFPAVEKNKEILITNLKAVIK